MKPLLLLALAALLGASGAPAQTAAPAPVDRRAIAVKLTRAFGDLCMPYSVSPDGKTYVNGGMFFYHVEKKIADPERLPDFGVVLAVDSERPLAVWMVETEMYAELLKKLEKAGWKKKKEDGDLDLDELRTRYARTDAAKAQFDGWVEEINTRLTHRDTQKIQLQEPGFSHLGWLSPDTAVFYCPPGLHAGPLAAVVHRKTKVVTLYTSPETSIRMEPVKYLLWPGRRFPGVSLVVRHENFPEDVQQLIKNTQPRLDDANFMWPLAPDWRKRQREAQGR